MYSRLTPIKPKKMSIDAPEKSTKILPTLYLPLDAIPAAKDWESGGTYHLELEVKQKSYREDETGGEVSFEILKVGTEEDEDQSEDDNEE